MRVAVIGAGAAGLATAKVLTRAGHEVLVFDRTPDVGGVWSRTRRYPGVTTQSPRDTYAFSDHPMPRDYPEWPDGEQVQRYFASYATRFGLEPLLRLGTEVTAAHREAAGWTIETRTVDTGRTATHRVDELVVANGVFCEPAVPDYPGRAEFESAGGSVLAATELLDAERARGRDVVVVGYGKSACDVAVALSDVAATTSVIARHTLWKVPRRIGGVVNFKFLLLTRMGEALFRYSTLRGVEKFLHGPGNPIRRNMVNSLGSAFMKQYKVADLGLTPSGTMEDIVKGAIGLVTEGFHERVRDGRIAVHRDTTVLRLLEKDGRPHAELADGSVVAADLVVCATGFRQGVPFLDEDVRAGLFDADGNFLLYRHVLPPAVAHLHFAGYNSSFFSPLNAEAAAIWIAAHLAGGLDLPDQQSLQQAAQDRITFMDSATGGHHCHGTKIIPFSLHNVDELLSDVGVDIGRLTKAKHWLAPVNPSAYRKITPRVLHRLAERGSGASPPAAAPPAVSRPTDRTEEAVA